MQTIPHSEGAETGLIGALLLDGERVLTVCANKGIIAESFYVPANQIVFKCCLYLASKGRPIDAQMVCDEIRKRGQLDVIGGALYLDDCIDKTPTAQHASFYADEVAAEYKKRIVLKSMRDVEGRLMDGEDLDVVLPSHLQEVTEATEEKKGSTKRGAWKSMQDRAWHIRGGGTAGLMTPWEVFNDTVGGAPFGKPTIVAGREGTRKSYLINQWAVHAAVECGVPGVMFSLEDGVEETIARSACYLADVNPWQMFVRGRFTQMEMDDVDSKAAEVIASPLEIIGERGGDIDSIAATIARGVSKHGWRFAFIDAFKDVYGRGNDTGMMDVYKVNRISDIAQRHNMAVIVTHHINKVLADDEGYGGKGGDEDDSQFISYRSITGRAEITKAARMIIMLQCRAHRDKLNNLCIDRFVLDCQKFTSGPPGSSALLLDENTGRFSEHPEDIEKWKRVMAGVRERQQ